MAIKDWPEDERPREKLLKRGPQSLSDAELLAIFLRTGLPGKSAVTMARELLNEFGGLRPLLWSDADRFCRSPGLGQAKYAQLQAVLEMGRRHLFEQLKRGEALTNPTQTRQYLMARLAGELREVFFALFLDSQHRVLSAESLFQGTLDAATVYPREVVKRALSLNAAAMIIAHNHPSGVAEPSQADRRITERLREALALVDIRLLDHFVVAGHECLSLAERGWI